MTVKKKSSNMELAIKLSLQFKSFISRLKLQGRVVVLPGETEKRYIQAAAKSKFLVRTNTTSTDVDA